MYKLYRASLVALMVKNRPANAGDIKRCNVRETGWSPVLRRSPGGGRGDSFQHPCLENPMDRGACQVDKYTYRHKTTTGNV